MKVEQLLDRLGNVFPSGAGYRASCPTDAHPHGDRSRGLSVTATDDRVLIHCFAGCAPEAICDVLGIRVADLFYERDQWEPAPLLSYRQRCEIAGLELMTILLGVDDILHEKELNVTDAERIRAATRRLWGIVELGFHD